MPTQPMCSPQGIAVAHPVRHCRTTRLCGRIFSSPRRILAVGDLSSRPAIGRANSRRLCRARWQKHPHRRDDARSGGIDRLDLAARGIDRVRENLARLQLSSIHAVRADASGNLTGSLGPAYDRILVDAPCSGLGTLRSHPEIKWQRNESDIKRLCCCRQRFSAMSLAA